MKPDVYIYDAVHTPRGKARASGALHGIKAVELVKQLLSALVRRNDISSEDVEDVVLGCVTQTGEQGANLAKIGALYAGFGPSVSGATINRFCASGLDAIRFAAMGAAHGENMFTVGGGVESMSRVPMYSDNGAWFSDPEVAAATQYVHMGVSADLIATQERFTREQLDELALSSQHRAAAARAAGHFSGAIVPVCTPGTDAIVLDQNELIRASTTADRLASLPVAFAEHVAANRALIAKAYPDLGDIEPRHTTASSPAMADAASLLLLGASDRKHALVPRARIVASATAGVEPIRMLTGNVEASKKALRSAGLRVADIDVFEVNESFAATVLHYQRHLDVPADKLNPCGGAIALGHPLGATGGILVATLLAHLERTGGRYGLASICGGAGLATALIIERA